MSNQQISNTEIAKASEIAQFRFALIAPSSRIFTRTRAGHSTTSGSLRSRSPSRMGKSLSTTTRPSKNGYRFTTAAALTR